VIVSTFGPEGPTNVVDLMLCAMTRTTCTSSSVCILDCLRVRKTYTKHRLEHFSSFSTATAGSNNQV
jgi:hypothetical protein